MKDCSSAIQCLDVVKTYALYQKQRDRLLEALHPGGKVYHSDFNALDGISFSVQKGECVGIVGKNGSGKSTLLKILTGVLTPTAGTASVRGRVSALLELGAGFNPEYTGYENIYLNGAVMGYSRQEMKEKIPQIISFADIGDFMNQPVKIYSSGMFVRLAFAVAINVDPDVLIIDEALAVGDVFFQLKCYKKFEDFKQQGKTILFVSHDQSSIIKYCDRAILLEQGRKVCEGTPKNVIDEYKQRISDTSRVESLHSIEQAEVCNFSLWRTAYQLNEKTLEYGSMDAEILDFGIFDFQNQLITSYFRNEEYAVKMKVKFYSAVHSPIFAITFKDMAGLEIAGTNTMQENIDVGNCSANQIVTVTFKHKFPFQNHPLFLSFGCTYFDSNGNLQVLHRLYDILCIQPTGAKVTNGFFDIDAKVTISRG